MNTSLKHTHHKLKGNTIGGKALGLRQLDALGLPVPKWMVIPHESLEALLESQGQKDPTSYIKQLQLPVEIKQAVQDHFSEEERKGFFAVRSSGVDEDGGEYSFAGQFESHLYVRLEEIASYIKQVWLSAYSARVRRYREQQGIAADPAIAVIIQVMVPATVSGVAFGINPTSGHRNEQVISTVYGLGEGLVSGKYNADTFVFREGNITMQLATKTHQLSYSTQAQKIVEQEVSLARQDQPSLSEQQVQLVVNALSQLKTKLGKPQDLEFAFVGETFYLLQSRPITHLGRVADPEGEKIVWDNSNIIESYPGVTTPLTFSFIINMYEAVYTQLGLLLGMKEAEVAAHKHTFAHMLGLLNGRVYYNLKSWFKLLALLPAYSLNARYMEKMMGVKERFELAPEDYPQLTPFQAKWRLGGTLFKMLASLRRLPRERRKFQVFLDRVIGEYQEIDFDAKRPDELMHLYQRFEEILVKEWNAPLVNDFFAMIFFGSLEKLIQAWNIGNNPNLHNDLHCGSQDIISTEPITRLFTITTTIQKHPEAKEVFQKEDPERILQILQKGDFPEIAEQINQYLDAFGERCVGELKLETRSYKQAPSILIDIIKSYVIQGVTTRLNNDNLEEKLRIEAEAEVRQSLKGKPIKGLIFRYVLRKSRDLVSSRENLRYERTRGFGVVRSIFTALGKQFFAEGLIANPDDIFYLTKGEIFSFISGTAVSLRFKETIALRKQEYETYRKLGQPSDRITTMGMVYQGNDLYPVNHDALIEGDLTGIGCCPGRVKGKVRVILDPRTVNTLGGDILVTTSTDPGWVTLFPTAAAIIVERGSLLSHSAIVSREMGIPCIVGVDGLLANLKSGDLVEIDGSTGIIKRH